MFAAGVVGVIAANVVTSAPIIKYTDKMEGEEYYTSAGSQEENDVQQVVVPVTPVTSTSATTDTLPASTVEGASTATGNLAAGSTQQESTDGNTSGETGEVSGINHSDGSITSGNSVNPEDLSHAENPENSDGSEKTNQSDNCLNQDDQDNPGNSDQSDHMDNSGNEGQSGDADHLDQSGDAGNADHPDQSGDADRPDQSGDAGNADQSGDVDQSGDAGNVDQSGDAGNADQSGDQDYTGKPDKPNKPDIPQQSNQSGTEKPSWSLDLKPGLGESISDSMIDVDKFQPEQISPERIKNATLVMNQKLVKLPKLVEDYRFWTVTRKYAFAKENLIIRESVVSEEVDENKIRAVGKLRRNGLLYILKEENDGWLYVESGRVRGFVRSEEIVTGEEANQQLEAYQKKAKKKAERLKTEYTGIEGTAPMARELLSWKENEAFTYLRATVNQTVVEKKYALPEDEDEDVEVMEEMDESSRVIGVIPEGGLCYILEDENEEWMYVESGNVRGFVKSDSIESGKKVNEKVEKEKEDTFSLAEEKIEPEENKAFYYTLTSTKSGIPNGEIRRSMVEYAAQFIGNPYVWGGTSLTEGADCSGFVQSIYKQYGYDLPRVSQDQAQYGTKIPVEDALPGDLIFYANNGDVYHVVMYAGDGKTIEAMSTDMGIVQADVSKNSAVWATRVLDDNGYEYAGGGISDVNATEDMYGKNLGTFKLTYYCACELCCDVETGITATGAPVVEGRTIAVDPNVIPYGTQVIIGGHVFTAEDCGGAIKKNHIDIYVNDHATALALGVNYADVYLKK